jgi:hypothetical protein
MASSDREDFIYGASTSYSHASSYDTGKCDGNTSNVNEESYVSPIEKFDHSASNDIEHINRESPKSEDFEGINDEREEYGEKDD